MLLFLSLFSQKKSPICLVLLFHQEQLCWQIIYWFGENLKLNIKQTKNYHISGKVKFCFTTSCLEIYRKLVKVQMLCSLCNNWSLFVPRELTPELAWHLFKHSLGEVSSTKKDRPFRTYWQRQKDRVLESIFTINLLVPVTNRFFSVPTCDVHN